MAFASAGTAARDVCVSSVRRRPSVMIFERGGGGGVKMPGGFILSASVKAWVNPGRGDSGKQNTIVEPFGTFRGMCLGRNGRGRGLPITTLSHTLRGLTHTSTDSETRVFTL